MRKLILATLCIACIWAYPEKYNFNIQIDNIEIKNSPSIKEKIVEAVPALLDGSCTWSLIVDPTLINDCVDETITKIDTYVTENIEPIELPEMHEGFNYTLIITYFGELDLSNGQINGLSSLQRLSDAYLDVGVIRANFSVPLSFKRFALTYDYSATIMNLGPSGGIEATVTDLEFEVGFGFDINNQELSLTLFHITKSGDMDFNFTGQTPVDWLLNLLADTVTGLLEKVVLYIMENIVEEAIQAAVDAINEILHSKNNIAVVAKDNTPHIAYKYVKP